MDLTNDIQRVLLARVADTDMLNVAEVLNVNDNELQKAFDTALAMENMNLVKLMYSNFNARKIVVEFTLVGKSESLKLLANKK